MFYDYAVFADKDVPAERVKTITGLSPRTGRARARPAVVPRPRTERMFARSTSRSTTARSPISARKASRRESEVQVRRGRRMNAKCAVLPAPGSGHQRTSHRGRSRAGSGPGSWTVHSATPTDRRAMTGMQATCAPQSSILMRSCRLRAAIVLDRRRLDAQYPGPAANLTVHRADAGGGARPARWR